MRSDSYIPPIYHVLWFIQSIFLVFLTYTNVFLEHFNKVEGKDWKKQTLNTFFIRMIQKGALKSERKETYCLYSPIYKREEYEQMRAQNLLNTMYGGKLKNFILALSGGKKISKEDAAELKKLLD